MEDIKKFITKYRGAILGGILGIIALILQLHKIMVGAIIILGAAAIGNYVQYNKEKVKEKLKEYIDKF